MKALERSAFFLGMLAIAIMLFAAIGLMNPAHASNGSSFDTVWQITVLHEDQQIEEIYSGCTQQQEYIEVGNGKNYSTATCLTSRYVPFNNMWQAPGLPYDVSIMINNMDTHACALVRQALAPDGSYGERVWVCMNGLIFEDGFEEYKAMRLKQRNLGQAPLY